MVRIDNIFLTIEGIGQYTMMQYYMSNKVGNFTFSDALEAARHNKSGGHKKKGWRYDWFMRKLAGKIEWAKLFEMKGYDLVDLIEEEL
jgi:hypothetical protein